MENYEQLLNLGAPLTSAFRSLSPSVLGKHNAQIQAPKPPNPARLFNLSSLGDLGRSMLNIDMDAIKRILGGMM